MYKQIKKTAWDSSAATDDKQSANKSINIITENKRFCNLQTQRVYLQSQTVASIGNVLPDRQGVPYNP